jgi:hypothetical protein
MSRAFGFGIMVIVFATLLPDIFTAVKILLLKVLGLASIVLDNIATAGIHQR